uniref:Uncharacterized protein n=1 Tax=Odontella aurita TaxID=265563 RepID=A0A7S4J3A5_9STRA|mmetsp:Transcript_37170/g.111311  ORF Transcript_37170/g.111311 Transcript_37170/m.111311 type:complete len:712 (+) Transcript_37170:154-2289(+)|eukprot:CAMPEP_0113534710 /NCGR_PEP_ID=MMETSP0015_2-20120614/5306_1 /TAXON_ID=2838 /ORGANISM="Odontella" /LENGTH=711 /DNA_ID=CAMNT_0000433893 /DNA_START=59 /DNA_END=2194 /DNA_ORIENTATION=+ /assembly_acc=CAM_ASM_000160
MDVALFAASLAVASFLPSPFHADDSDGASSGAASIKATSSALDALDVTSPSGGVDDSDNGGRVGSLRRSRARAAVRISLLLSLLLLSLGVLEAAPSTWLIFLYNDGRSNDGVGAPYSPRGWFSGKLTVDGHLRLTTAYGVLLWADSLLVALVAPGTVGGLCLAWLFPPRPALLKSQSSLDQVPEVMGSDRWTIPWRIIRSLMKVLFLVASVIATTVRFALVLLLGRTESRPAIAFSRATSNASSSEDLERGAQATPSPSRLARHASLQRKVTCTTRAASEQNLLQSIIPSRVFLIGSIAGVSISFLFLRFIGSFVAEDAPVVSMGEVRSHRHVCLRDVVSRLSALGVFLSQLLNGFGCVSLPYSCLSGLYLEPIDARTLADATERYKFLLKSLEDKRRVLADIYTHHNSDLPVMTKYSSLAFDIRQRCSSSPPRYPKGDTVEALRKEVEFTESLSEELADDIENMKDLSKQSAMARTPLGRVRGWVGAVFSIILLVRVALAVIGLTRASFSTDEPDTPDAIVAPDISPSRKDPITMVLLWLVGRDMLNQGGNFDAAAQCASLILTAVLSVTQVRTFLRVAGALSRRIRCWFFCGYGGKEGQIKKSSSSWRGPAKDAGTYLAVSVLGCYFQACIVLMKRNLPVEHRSAFSAALGGDSSDQIAFDMRVTNGAFAASALVSCFALGALFGIRRRNSAAHSSYAHIIPECLKSEV